MVITALGSLAVSIADLKPYVHLPLIPHLTRDHQVCRSSRGHAFGRESADEGGTQLYRLAIHQIVFQNSVELLMAELSLYQTGRYVERWVRSQARENAVPMSLGLIIHADLSGLASTRWVPRSYQTFTCG